MNNDICYICGDTASNVALVHIEGVTIVKAKVGRYEGAATRHIPVCKDHHQALIQGLSFVNNQKENTMNTTKKDVCGATTKAGTPCRNGVNCNVKGHQQQVLDLIEEAQEERDYQHVSGKYENPIKCGNTKVHGRGNNVYHDGADSVKACFMGETVDRIAAPKHTNVRTSTWDIQHADRLEQFYFNSGRKISNPYAGR